MAMHTLSKFFLFSSLFATGVSLECETCFGVGSSCIGKMETCRASQDVCSISSVENGIPDGTDTSLLLPGGLIYPRDISTIFQNSRMPPRIGGGILRSIQKGCEGLPFCTIGDIYMNIGHNRTLRGSNICCKGADCQKFSPDLPPRHHKPNGKQCPACFAVSYGCPDKTVECIGPETHCFAVRLVTKFGKLGVVIFKATMKGCATKSFCDLSQTRGRMYGRPGFDIVESYCSSARKTPGSFGFHFLVLSSLLLMLFLV